MLLGGTYMKRLVIFGGKRLSGRVEISGFKNAALPILYASIVTDDVSVIENVPRISDVEITLSLLREMGAIAHFTGKSTVLLDTRGMRADLSSYSLCQRLRASTYLLGASLARFGRARIERPGGCSIGARPIDLHLFALSVLGADITEEGGAVEAKATALQGATVKFPSVSVGATVNAILCALSAAGETHILGAAKEPHIGDLCRYLIACGADIGGVGTDTLVIKGGRSLHGCVFRLMPDMIEAGTFLCAVGAAGGEAFLKNAREGELMSVIEPLRAMGLTVKKEGEGLFVSRRGELSPFCLTAMPYPAFPTDMHPQMVALGCLCSGESYLSDTVFPDRFRYTEELSRLGASLSVEGNRVTVRKSALHRGRVTAVDLRAGAALAVASLSVKGKVTIENAQVIERGYVALPEKLRALGAEVLCR